MTREQLIVLTVMAFGELQSFYGKTPITSAELISYIEAYLCGKYNSSALDTFDGWQARGYRIKAGAKSVMSWECLDLDSLGNYDHLTLSERIEAGKIKRVFFSSDVYKPNK